MRMKPATLLKMSFVVVVLLNVTACGSATLGTSSPRLTQQLNCAGWKPIIMDKQDVLVDMTLDQINAHNQFGEEQGCWTPPNG